MGPTLFFLCVRICPFDIPPYHIVSTIPTTLEAPVLRLSLVGELCLCLIAWSLVVMRYYGRRVLVTLTPRLDLLDGGLGRSPRFVDLLGEGHGRLPCLAYLLSGGLAWSPAPSCRLARQGTWSFAPPRKLAWRGTWSSAPLHRLAR